MVFSYQLVYNEKNKNVKKGIFWKLLTCIKAFFKIFNNWGVIHFWQQGHVIHPRPLVVGALPCESLKRNDHRFLSAIEKVSLIQMGLVWGFVLLGSYYTYWSYFTYCSNFWWIVLFIFITALVFLLYVLYCSSYIMRTVRKGL